MTDSSCVTQPETTAAPPRFVVQMSGAPGAGKSTVANLLAKPIDAIVIDHDVIRSFFLESGHGFGPSAKLAYDFQWTLAGDILRQGRNVIIDSTCNYQETLDQGVTLARRYSCEYRYVECRVEDIDLLDHRLRSRVSRRSQRTGVRDLPLDAHSHGTHGGGEDNALARFRQWIKNPVRPASNAIVVNSTSRPDDCLDEIRRQMAFSTGVPTSHVTTLDPSPQLPGSGFKTGNKRSFKDSDSVFRLDDIK